MRFAGEEKSGTFTDREGAVRLAQNVIDELIERNTDGGRRALLDAP